MTESIATSIQAAATAAQHAKAARGELIARRAGLEAKLSGLKERNAYVSALPLTLEDGRRFVLEAIDVLARQFVERARFPSFVASFAYPQRGWPGGLEGPSRRPLALADLAAVRDGGIQQLGNGPTNFFVGNGGSLNPLAVDADALCFFFGEAIKEKLKAHVEDWFPDYREDVNAARRPKFHGHYANATPEDLASSVDARLAEIKANDEKAAQLEQEIDELNEALADFGALAGEGAA